MRSHTNWPWSSWIFHDRVSRERKRWNLSIRWRTAPSSGRQSCVHTQGLEMMDFPGPSLSVHAQLFQLKPKMNLQSPSSPLSRPPSSLHQPPPASPSFPAGLSCSQTSLPTSPPIKLTCSPCFTCMTQHIQTFMYCRANRFSMHPSACINADFLRSSTSIDNLFNHPSYQSHCFKQVK